MLPSSVLAGLSVTGVSGAGRTEQSGDGQRDGGPRSVGPATSLAALAPARQQHTAA